MLFLISQQQTKPNRVTTPEIAKDENYHTQYARWVIGSGSSTLQDEYQKRYELNRNFYANKQWIMEEDTEAFFKDLNNNDRNRIMVTRNYIQPMVEQYRGNAIRMTFDMKVANISPMARSRKDKALAKLLTYNAVAKKMPGFMDHLTMNNMPTGADQTEITSKFDNLYSDMFVISTNRLLRYSKELNKLEELKPDLALDVALAGIGIMKPYPHGGEWLFKRVSPPDFGWDRTAKSSTLTDSDFFFEYTAASVTSILERHQNITLPQRKSIEEYATRAIGTSKATGAMFDASGKVPVYTSVWRDLTVDTFGYVNDEFGQRILARIDYIEENQSEPKYTSKDLVPYKDLTDYQKRVMKGEQTTQLYVDLWRYAEFVPQEILVAADGSFSKDIVLDYGILPYQEPDLYRPTNMLPPYKVGIWSYLDGEVLSPVDVVINPQRMINRFLSVMENQLNSSGGAGVIYDKDLLGNTPEDEVKSAINRGDSVGVNAKGRGVQNIIGRYDATPKESILAFSALIENYKAGIEQVTGVNEGVKGDTGNPDQLVGVMQLMIQRGSIIQEPFYQAITDIYKGCYQSIATSGKRYYIDHETELVDVVGEDAAQVLILSKDMRWESMRVTLVRTMDAMNERMTVDSNIISWLQFGLIDQPTVANLIGRATMEEAVLELKEFQKRLANQKRMAAAAQQDVMAQRTAVANQAGQVAYEESIRDKTREDMNKQADRNVQLMTAAK